ncbi:CoA transferase subunit A [Ruegeria pomeroyi]|uniref:CoA transferase subunit A n=1 Tax=Ruegeria alba TaxID=2916756 RepID=A0ABS9NT18_9RHOB|nr:CoA transferase subunit A [Ruegeria alba]MCE8511992.1 CoA transferase subunit A [Ruegeria pomeroyi]MCE8520560.1 CoA transferase subunit A [Ruegeria pomeroyi]MCE8524889.1 CoA transferase subunit A [Ruegeria pomeroyi]MCE8528574.1 CoA transferase subunit A [Ruegeria pomeroyi]MCE8533006.1 CoA transferase subunit A [Ruegeria pomeroyi]
MKLPDKQCSLEGAIARIRDGDTVMIGGFGVPGTPMALIHALVAHGARELTIVKNDANEPGMGVDHLLQSGQISRLITTHLGLNSRAIDMMNAGRITVEFNAQGILAERIRAGGAGVGAVLTDIGIGTELANGKQVVELAGKPHIVETALRADVALIHAAAADRFGNLAFVATARNFNPLMAMAADCVIAEAETLLPLGGLTADAIHTAGVFVDHVTELGTLSKEYDVVRRK